MGIERSPKSTYNEKGSYNLRKKSVGSETGAIPRQPSEINAEASKVSEEKIETAGKTGESSNEVSEKRPLSSEPSTDVPEEDSAVNNKGRKVSIKAKLKASSQQLQISPFCHPSRSEWVSGSS